MQGGKQRAVLYDVVRYTFMLALEISVECAMELIFTFFFVSYLWFIFKYQQCVHRLKKSVLALDTIPKILFTIF